MAHWKDCPFPECRRARGMKGLRWLLGAVALVAFVVCIVLASGGCTVVPKPVAAASASYDEGGQNSGFLEFIEGGAIITPHARDRYNALIADYGRSWQPALEVDHGIRPSRIPNFFITSEALQKFIVMNQWRKLGRAPDK